MVDELRQVPGSVTAPRGFRAGSTAAGIKSDATIKDLAVLLADVPCVAAATFTTSRTPAAPVLVCKENLATAGFRAQAVVVNSGNANCSTGEPGLADARMMAQRVGERFGIAPELVQVSSTGIIGRRLPMDKVAAGIAQVEVAADGGDALSDAILTTDTRAKKIAVEFMVDGTTVRLAGTTKGAGMIYPNMATMLCYITTDAAVEQRWLQSILRAAVNDSFNMICVDGDMSTNDTVLVMASGLAANAPLAGTTPGAAAFEAALRHVTRYLAREIARDGEGMTKLMEVRVLHAATDADARKAARSVTLSPLWQCALAGQDPNWGRILAALGASGADFAHERVAITLGQVPLVQDGLAVEFAREHAVAQMTGDEVIITVDLGAGEAAATAWGCDLTHGYIDENTLYTR
ncbi:MAG: bifunctional glutamate N-acetyltransferase/amino-acid acetyltransferase ArgJ [Ktedonobacterales bacterium]|nr:bifunctional glutamate N-acetyltransferase/amino-acid acetyltransferase ArgJ [Ktedonobacterales bacterium]